MRAIVVTLALSVASIAVAAPSVPKGVVGQPYAAAREAISAAGWRPHYQEAFSEWEREFQKVYPELRACAIDRPVCALFFVAEGGSCLKVIVEGEQMSQFVVSSIARQCDE